MSEASKTQNRKQKVTRLVNEINLVLISGDIYVLDMPVTADTAYSTWTLCESLPVSGICSLESTHGLCHFSMLVLLRRGPVTLSPLERYPVNVQTNVYIVL